MSGEDGTGCDQLRTFIEEHYDALLHQLRIYVLNWRLASGDDVLPMTEQLLSDVVFEALRVADRFDSNRSPMAWLLGIGVNLVKRRLVAQNQRNKRELYVSDMYAQTEMSEEEIFERYFPSTTSEQFTHNLEANESWNELVAAVPESDQELLRLKYYAGLKDKRIATILNIDPQAVRQRLSRARQRLRNAHKVENEGDRL